jgi:hypothetical protein
MSGKGLLILEYDNLDRGAAAFYQQLNNSPSLQQAFLDDPAGILRRMIFPNAPFPPEGIINKANRLLYALLSNQNFLSWSRQFQSSIEGEIQQVAQADNRNEAIKGFLASFDRNRLYSEIVDGILESIDKETLYSLVVGTKLNDTVSSVRVKSSEYLYTNDYVASESYVVVYIAAVAFLFVSQIDITPFTEPEGISRADLQRISASLTSALQEKAVQIRDSGALTSVDSVDKGGSL